jgi:signal transduction histidine kinase
MSDILLADSILDRTSSCICIIDSANKIVSINSRFARLLDNKSRESLSGKDIAACCPSSPDFIDFFARLSSISTDSDIPAQTVLCINRNGEKPLWIKFDISQVQSSKSGMCTYINGTDVTEEIITRREAEQRAQERSSFLVRMGHEIRTPLNTVIGYSQLLQSLENLSPVAQEYIATIIHNEKNLLHLLNDVLELSKYEAGQTVTVLSPTNIKKLVQEVTDSFSDQFNEKYLSLSVEYKTAIPDELLTDSQKVGQVISNIIGNALKFTRKGGVSLSISYDRMLTIDIEDTGIGIDPSEFSQVFNIFIQSGDSKEYLKGSSIGLGIARIFARMLGGDIVLVRSDIGKGSFFRFTFAANTIETNKKATLSVPDYTQIKGISRPCKVLLVDDVDINLAMLEIFLAPAGFDVSIAANGNEALSKFKSFKPDIVFMDLIMPEKDGFEATKEIKAIDSKIPVVALTASIVDSVKEKALASGVNDFMNKPFIPERFFEIIAEHTGISYI